MADTYKVTFKSKSSIGIVLYELNAWCINRSEYEISDTELVLYHCSANVVDVVTESLTYYFYKIEKE